MICKHKLLFYVWSFSGRYEDFDFNSIGSSDEIEGNSKFSYIGIFSDLANFGSRVFSVKHFDGLPYDFICFVSED